MSSLRDIRKRIHSVQSVKQITRAMEMIAGVRLHRAQKRVEQSRHYSKQIYEVLNQIYSEKAGVEHPFFEERDVHKIGVLIVSSDKGLCGSYNTHIFSMADKFLKSLPAENVELILVGRKAINHYAKGPWKIRHEIKDWGGKFNFSDIKHLAYQLMDWYLLKELDQIWVIYSQFVSTVTRKAVKEQFLGLPKPQKQPSKRPNYIFEPDEKSVYNDLLPRYAISKILTMLNEAYASELAARTLSMHKATQNAEEMITKLTLKRNKIRQSNITREIIEIASGAEGLK